MQEMLPAGMEADAFKTVAVTVVPVWALGMRNTSPALVPMYNVVVPAGECGLTFKCDAVPDPMFVTVTVVVVPVEGDSMFPFRKI